MIVLIKLMFALWAGFLGLSSELRSGRIPKLTNVIASFFIPVIIMTELFLLEVF